MPLTWNTFEYMRAHFNDICGVAEIVLIDCDYMTCPKKKLTKIYHILQNFKKICKNRMCEWWPSHLRFIN